MISLRRLQVRIDHRSPGLFVFGGDVALAPYEAQTVAEAPTESQMPTDRVRSQLVMLLTSLTRTSRVIKSQHELVSRWLLELPSTNQSSKQHFFL